MSQSPRTHCFTEIEGNDVRVTIEPSINTVLHSSFRFHLRALCLNVIIIRVYAIHLSSIYDRTSNLVSCEHPPPPSQVSPTPGRKCLMTSFEKISGSETYSLGSLEMNRHVSITLSPQLLLKLTSFHFVLD